MNTLEFASKKVAHNFKHINYEFEEDDGLLWVYLDAYPRPCVTPQLVDDIRTLHRTIEVNRGNFPTANGMQEVKYHILDSHTDGVFSLGGDLAYFLECLKSKDKVALTNYARNCINAIYPIMVNFNQQLVTISLVRGSALGGGFEIALSGDVIIAERSAQLGFPEILFNTFPGMGAYQSLSSRIGLQQASKLIASGKLYPAEELYDMGVIDVLVDDNCGEEAVYSYVHNHKKHWKGHMAMQAVTNRLKAYDYQEIMDICCNDWVESVFDMSDRDMRTVERLLRSQARYVPQDTAMPAPASVSV